MITATWKNQRVRVLDVIAEIIVGEIEPHLWKVPFYDLTNVLIEKDALPFDYKSDYVSQDNLRSEE
jgi:hypothetical protein